jgi:excisionase family DNA binding protein
MAAIDTDVVAAVSLDEPLIDVEAAAELLCVRPSWVRDAVRAERLPVIRVGRHMRFTKQMLEDWAARHRIENAQPSRFVRAPRTRRPR